MSGNLGSMVRINGLVISPILINWGYIRVITNPLIRSPLIRSFPGTSKHSTVHIWADSEGPVPPWPWRRSSARRVFGATLGSGFRWLGDGGFLGDGWLGGLVRFEKLVGGVGKM